MDHVYKTMEDNAVLEPVCKKAKIPESIDSVIENILNSNVGLEGILSDDYLLPIPLVKVYIGQVKSVRDLSKIILILNEKNPLKELCHLKRARRKEILLFPVNYINNDTDGSIENYIEENINELKDSFEYFKICSVPSEAPKLQSQYNVCAQIWPCNFHPNKYIEKVYNRQIFNEHELKMHRFYMSMAFEIARYYLKIKNVKIEQFDILCADLNAAVVVDPSNESVVAVAFDNKETQPIQHSAMLAIDKVAKTQNGGAWETSTDIGNINLKGLGCMDLLIYLKNKYPNINFGAKNYISKSDLEEQNLNATECPYLCTGYYIYLIREPCLMCSMALVHARISRVFFYKRHNMGALCSKTKLHCVQSLNHHFEVYTSF